MRRILTSVLVADSRGGTAGCDTNGGTVTRKVVEAVPAALAQGAKPSWVGAQGLRRGTDILGLTPTHQTGARVCDQVLWSLKISRVRLYAMWQGGHVSQETRRERECRLLYPHPSSPGVTAVMKANVRVDTKPEVRLRAALHRLGYRFRKDMQISAASRRCRPDIVFTRRRVAIFVDGCFWHQCPKHGSMPKVNAGYWHKKFRRNIARDQADTQALSADGWCVLRIWEHVPVEESLHLVVTALAARFLSC